MAPDQATAEAAVQATLDAAARAAGYDSIVSAVSYAEDAEVPAYMVDGRRFRRWRSRVWAACYQHLAAGDCATTEDLIAALPPLVDPDPPAPDAPPPDDVQPGDVR